MDANRKPSRIMGREDFQPTDLTTVYWLSGAGFLVNTHGRCLMIDPVLLTDPENPNCSESGLPLKTTLPLDPALIPSDCAVLYTHADADHLGPKTALQLAQQGLTFVGTLCVFERLVRLGIPPEQIQVLRTHECTQLSGIKVECIPADHPWQLKDLKRGGRPYRMGDCCGFILNTPDGRLCFPGDTRLMEYHLSIQDIQLLALDVSTCEYHLNHTSAVVLANHFPDAFLLPFHYGTYDCPTVAAHVGEPEDIYPYITNSDQRGFILAPGEPFVLPKRVK